MFDEKSLFNRSGFVPFGAAMPKQGIQKFTAKKGQTQIKVLSTSEEYFVYAKVHYLEGVGYFHCFGGSCCKACADAGDKGSSSERAILPIAVYKASLTGGATLDFAYLPLPEQKYSALLSLHTSVGDITTYDIIIDCEDEKYQKYTFTPVISVPPIYNSIPDAEMASANFLRDYQATIMKTLGKSINEVEFNNLRAKALQQAANNVGVTFQPNATASQAFMNNAPQVALPQPKPAIAQQVQAIPQQPIAPQVVAPQQPVAPQVVAPQQPVVIAPANIPTQEVIQEAQVVAAEPVAEPVQQAAETAVSETFEETDWQQFLENGV